MPEKLLPVYQIQDFDQLVTTKNSDFYLNTFENHLREHTFIQKPHKHDFFIILLITQGTGTHTIDFVTYPVAPQMAFFLSPGQVHAWQLSDDTRGHILFFSLDFYRTQQHLQNPRLFPFFHGLFQKPVLQIPLEQLTPLMDIVTQLKQELTHKEWQWPEVIREYLMILLVKLSRIYKVQYTNLPVSNSLWEQLEILIEQNFKKHQPVSFYAENLNLTEKQLNEACKNTFNKTTSALIQERVLLEAQRLLTHSNLTITQIAAELGYFDNSYFGRFFKKHTGQTPEQFRLNA
ncbi:helix-turn-helix domain-containing protein [Adhaeribacter swui]|uniref:Helix-turn-helix domain-containing protein n=2 Tax=Adhaeribacter swui TaxID=2086471 RepID=A0A7G7GEE9_9BACT|nr:helix-turn-helix domain-containing protein [Adhaeribacter swui]